MARASGQLKQTRLGPRRIGRFGARAIQSAALANALIRRPAVDAPAKLCARLSAENERADGRERARAHQRGAIRRGACIMQSGPCCTRVCAFPVGRPHTIGHNGRLRLTGADWPNHRGRPASRFMFAVLPSSPLASPRRPRARSRGTDRPARLLRKKLRPKVEASGRECQSCARLRAGAILSDSAGGGGLRTTFTAAGERSVGAVSRRASEPPASKPASRLVARRSRPTFQTTADKLNRISVLRPRLGVGLAQRNAFRAGAS